MTKCKFSRLLQSKVNMSDFKYLTGKKGIYREGYCIFQHQMSEYLLPTNDILTIDEKRRLFAIKNKITNLPMGKSKSVTICFCGQRHETHLWM